MKDAVRVELMNVAWGLCWAGSRSTKPCVFPCQVALAGDGRYLLCAAGAAAVVSSAIGSSSVFYAYVDSLVADRNAMAA